MRLYNPRLDDLVTRVYRTAATIEDTSLRELLRNVAVALLRAHDWEATEHCVELIRSLLVTAVELRLLDYRVGTALRDDVGHLCDDGTVELATAH